jgi:hypothetical protein
MAFLSFLKTYLKLVLNLSLACVKLVLNLPKLILNLIWAFLKLILRFLWFSGAFLKLILSLS